MGRIKQGANGAFSGKAGSVVGSSWKRIDYIKGLPKRKNNKPASMRQLEQQKKFRMVVSFLKPIKDMLNLTCASLKEGRATGFNMVLKQVLAEAILGDYPDYTIDYAAVKISYGSLNLPEGSAIAETGRIVKVSWLTELNKYTAFNDDEVSVVIYDELTNNYTFGPDTITRADGEVELTLGEHMLGRTLQVYYFLTNRDGKKISPTQYAGEVVVI